MDKYKSFLNLRFLKRLSLMIVFEHKNIIPIGCSCINQFQIQYYFADLDPEKKLPVSIFDWNIVTPDSTIKFLKMLRDKEIKSVMCDINNYQVTKAGLLRNTVFEAFYFWHEKTEGLLSNDDNKFDIFQSKVCHLIDNFYHTHQRSFVDLLWTNIQSNLKQTANLINLPWERFFLTKDRYSKMSSLGADLFGSKTRVTFVVRIEDLEEPGMAKLPNVHVLNSSRPVFREGDSEMSDYAGTPNLFAPVFDKLVP